MTEPSAAGIERVAPAPGVELPEGQPDASRNSGSDRQTERRSIRKAVALEYRRGGDQRAPVVSASGRGAVADHIIALAQEHGVYVQPDPDLVELLSRLDLGTAIPPQLYYVVAEILAFVYKLNSAQTVAKAPREGGGNLNLKDRL